MTILTTKSPLKREATRVRISSLIYKTHVWYAEIGTVPRKEGWLPRLHQVGPSASLDESIRKLFPLYITMGRDCQIKIRLTSARFGFRLLVKEKLNRNA